MDPIAFDQKIYWHYGRANVAMTGRLASTATTPTPVLSHLLPSSSMACPASTKCLTTNRLGVASSLNVCSDALDVIKASELDCDASTSKYSS